MDFNFVLKIINLILLCVTIAMMLIVHFGYKKMYHDKCNQWVDLRKRYDLLLNQYHELEKETQEPGSIFKIEKVQKFDAFFDEKIENESDDRSYGR